MKIAIMYSGLIRTLLYTIANNLECFSYGDIDLYFSVWDYVGYSDAINSPDFIWSDRKLDGNTIITEEVVHNIVADRTKIKKIKIEKYDKNKYLLDITNGIDNQNAHGQFYKIYDCFNLIDEDYDVVIRLRCDLLLNNKIEKDKLKQLIKNNKIIFANKIWYNHSWNDKIKDMNDMLWIGNKELTGKACGIYNNFDKINTIIKERKRQEINYGERICYMNLEAESMINNIETFDFNYNVVR